MPCRLTIGSTSTRQLGWSGSNSPASAKCWLEESSKNGTFKDVDDLQRVKGIGPKTVEKLRRWMTAGQTASDSDDGS
jgi:competence protein ComEA